MYALTARSGRNGGAVRTRSRVPEKRANLICSFRRENVLTLACLLLDLAFAVHSQTVGEQAFRQSMASNNAGGTLATARRQFDNLIGDFPESPLAPDAKKISEALRKAGS